MVIGRVQIGVMVAGLVCIVGAGFVSAGRPAVRTTLLGGSPAGSASNGGKVVARFPQETSASEAARQEPRPPGEDLIAGYQAYVAGEYDLALRHYEVALSQTADPGLVAYHQGVVLAA